MCVSPHSVLIGNADYDQVKSKLKFAILLFIVLLLVLSVLVWVSIPLDALADGCKPDQSLFSESGSFLFYLSSAAYFVLVTISTVGFGDIRPLYSTGNNLGTFIGRFDVAVIILSEMLFIVVFLASFINGASQNNHNNSDIETEVSARRGKKEVERE